MWRTGLLFFGCAGGTCVPHVKVGFWRTVGQPLGIEADEWSPMTTTRKPNSRKTTTSSQRSPYPTSWCPPLPSPIHSYEQGRCEMVIARLKSDAAQLYIRCLFFGWEATFRMSPMSEPFECVSNSFCRPTGPNWLDKERAARRKPIELHLSEKLLCGAILLNLVAIPVSVRATRKYTDESTM